MGIDGTRLRSMEQIDRMKVLDWMMNKLVDEFCTKAH